MRQFGEANFKKTSRSFDKFSSENVLSEKSANSDNYLFWRSYAILDVTGSCSSKNNPRGSNFQLSATFGRGVKEMVSLFGHDFLAKMTFAKKVIYEVTKLWYSVVSWLEDTCVLARGHVCPGWRTHVSCLENIICVLARGHMCPGLRKLRKAEKSWEKLNKNVGKSWEKLEKQVEKSWEKLKKKLRKVEKRWKAVVN